GREPERPSLALAQLLKRGAQQRTGVGRDLARERAGVGRLDAAEDRLLTAPPARIEPGLPLAAEHALDHLLRLDGLDGRARALGRERGLLFAEPASDSPGQELRAAVVDRVDQRGAEPGRAQQRGAARRRRPAGRALAGRRPHVEVGAELLTDVGAKPKRPARLDDRDLAAAAALPGLDHDPEGRDDRLARVLVDAQVHAALDLLELVQ